MGDILHALPAITALRKAHPNWRIDWVVEPQWRTLLTAEPPTEYPDQDHHLHRSEARPVVDRIHLAPVKIWRHNPFQPATWSGISSLRSQLRSVEYDAVLDLQGSTKSAVVARMSGSRRILGEQNPRETAARWLTTETVETVGTHVVEQDVELASAIAGDLLVPMLPALPNDPDAELWVDGMDQIRTFRPIVLIHPGAGWGAKRWPADRYGAIVEDLAGRGAIVLINAGPGEEALAEAVIASTSRSNENVSVIQSSLAQLVALTRRVSLVIGGDTGPVHLASALGKPVIGIFGPTDPRRNGPFGSRFRVLRNPESRRDHTRREQTEAGLLTIWPEAVMAAAADLLLEQTKAGQASSRPEDDPSDLYKGPIWEAQRPEYLKDRVVQAKTFSQAGSEEASLK